MTAKPQATFLGHPIGLFVLFFTEMWERFSYYGMRALLILYMVEYFKWTQEDASRVYKWYTSLVYLTPLLGGFLADRYLGNRWAIIIGAVAMAIGHFLMAFEAHSIFFAALVFLIVGNGFFKPNMSVQVGRLYPQNDPRRDGAYTIFYMGINLGAFLSPIVCGAFRESPGLGYHWGFGAAGVGMVIGLVTYLFGLPFIKELPEDAVYEGPGAEKSKAGDDDDHAMTESEAATQPSAVPALSTMAPKLLMVSGAILGVLGLFFGVALAMAAYGSTGLMTTLDQWLKPLNVETDSAFALALGLGLANMMGGWIAGQVALALRDRVLSILVIAVFVIFFWGAFEQAGNAMNVWADQTTNRYLTEKPPEPDVYPAEPVDIEEQGFWTTLSVAFKKPIEINPILTTSFQSINAAAIVVFAPIFAWLWLFLARRGRNPSIATKVAIGVFMQGMAFALMMWAATYENGPSSTSLTGLPTAAVIEEGVVHFYDAPELDDEEGFEKLRAGERPGDEPMIAHGGRLQFDQDKALLNMTGVLDANHRDRMLRATAPAAYILAIQEMAEKSVELKESAVSSTSDEKTSFTYQLEALPEGFEPRYLQGFKSEDLAFDAETRTFTVGAEIADKDYKQILVAGADPTFRTAVNKLYISSTKYRVSSAWLFWFYILCTLGELCLSPVGLSMVSKLAPRRFATMLMGMWLLTSFFGNFTAGLAGENWDRLEPTTYFGYVTLAMVAASLVCFVLVKIITRMMHGVK